MRIECPKCSGISSISSDLIARPRRALELSCRKCRAGIHIQLSLSGIFEPDHPDDRPSEDQLTRLASPIAEEDSLALSMRSKILRSLVELPPMPNIILKAREIMEDPRSSLRELAAVIEHDQAIVARVLALANSAYYGLSGLVSSIQHASILLGQKSLGELITIAASSRLLSKKLKGYRLNPGDLWKHALAVALGSRIIAIKIKSKLVEDAFISGLLHDAGKIILDPYVLERQKAFKKFLKNNRTEFIKAEKKILGFDHAEVMSRAARFWRYPETQSTAIRYHHCPSASNNSQLAFIVHLADFSAKAAGFDAGDIASAPAIDPQALTYLGIKEEELTDINAEISESVEKLATEFQ